MAAHQAPPSLGFSRQEHWSGLPFPSPVHESEKGKWSRSVVSDSSRPHGPQPTRLLRPWDFPGKSTGVGCHCLLRFYILVQGKSYRHHLLFNLILFLMLLNNFFGLNLCWWNHKLLYGQSHVGQIRHIWIPLRVHCYCLSDERGQV